MLITALEWINSQVLLLFSVNDHDLQWKIVNENNYYADLTYKWKKKATSDLLVSLNPFINFVKKKN